MATTHTPGYANSGSSGADKEPVSENIHEQSQVSRSMEDDLEPGHFDVANIERIYR